MLCASGYTAPELGSMNYSYPVQPAVLNDQLLDSLNVVLLLLDIHQNTTLGAEHHFEQNKHFEQKSSDDQHLSFGSGLFL